ncbi:hypothetical protein SAMN05421690_101314 [Nitrosomonas sp. Nm51]|uniref:hypothetical protein n=1 Tax=Nitrosomonas sp. Nm51 TaxID=133720 RepID=UPI0008BD1DE3|nr:hypothetical protein [Nitrosomonas sp. Nm51]SER21705.1 hypothetical protein SAMN05421690_101314 [Nitrosomonas sp. Nm51]
MPPLSPSALRAAKELGYLSDHVNSDAMVITRLRQLWTDSQQSIKEFTHVEAALVHHGLHLRHHKLS